MKYYLVHMTFKTGTGREAAFDVLVKRDQDNMEMKAGMEGGVWRVGDEWPRIYVWDTIKEAVRNGGHEEERIRYKVRELTDEEAAMILFCKEGGQLE